MQRFSLFLLFWLAPSWVSGEEAYQEAAVTYGLDVSFPIHTSVSTNYPGLPHNVDPSLPVPGRYKDEPLQVLGNRQQAYLNHLNGCRAEAGERPYLCDNFEYERLRMNERQPQSIINMTDVGFKKVRAPPHLTELVTAFWQDNKDKSNNIVEENWGPGNSYFNYWNNPTKFLSVDDSGLRGSGTKLKQAIWASLSAVMEEWTQQELQPSSLYGIRIYEEGAVMLPHVDRLPLIASAILNVAQDVDEPWPTEIYDHQGRAHNITINPGEMLLFESASCIHGHPFPLKGKFYASMFIHFEPTGRQIGMNDDGYFYLRKVDSQIGKTASVDRQYREHSSKSYAGQSSSFDGRLPPYIKRDSPEEAHWLLHHPAGWIPPQEILPLGAHIAASKGKLADLQLLIEERGREVLTERDDQGWQVLHQGVAGGNDEVVHFLLEQGADINARTFVGGETPLRIAERKFGFHSSLARYLKSMGGLSVGPEL